MEIFDETKKGLRNIWEDQDQRQKAKIVMTMAMGNASNLTVKESQDILDELDRLLEPQTEEDKRKTNPGL